MLNTIQMQTKAKVVCGRKNANGYSTCTFRTTNPSADILFLNPVFALLDKPLAVCDLSESGESICGTLERSNDQLAFTMDGHVAVTKTDEIPLFEDSNLQIAQVPQVEGGPVLDVGQPLGKLKPVALNPSNGFDFIGGGYPIPNARQASYRAGTVGVTLRPPNPRGIAKVFIQVSKIFAAQCPDSLVCNAYVKLGNWNTGWNLRISANTPELLYSNRDFDIGQLSSNLGFAVRDGQSVQTQASIVMTVNGQPVESLPQSVTLNVRVLPA